MDLSKRLGLSPDLLKHATEILEGKKISHPNQKEISAAAPPEDEISAADFKALKAKKKHRVEGFDRNKKRYESPLFETYEEALTFFNKIRKSAPLTNLQIVDIEEAIEEGAGKAYRVDVKSEDTRLGNESETVYAKDRDDAAKKIEDRLKRAGRKDPLVQRVQNSDYQLRKEAEEVKLVDEAQSFGRTLFKTKQVAQHKDDDGNTHTMWTRSDNDHKTVYYSKTYADGKVGNSHKGMRGTYSSKDDAMSAFKKHVVNEAKEVDTTNANDARVHDCAKHVVHEQWGVGETVPTMHADPDSEGKIAWYDVMFEHGIERQVPVTDLEITLSETHVHKKSKRMSEAADSAEMHGKEKKHSKKKNDDDQVEFNPEYKKEEVEQVNEISHMAKADYVRAASRDATLAGTAKKNAKSEDEKQYFAKQEAKRKAGLNLALKNEEVELDEGRKAGVVGSVLSNPAAREHFKKLTGKEPSYFHISKNPDHAQAALNHAAKAKAPEGEKPAEAGDDDTEANKHPINQLRGIADRNGGKFMGKQITRAHATKLISMHDDLKPAQKLDFVANIGKHLAKVTS